MLGKKPLTREKLLELLDRPENAELKASINEDPKYKEIILDLVLKIDEHFDSYEEFFNALEHYEQMKKTVIA